MSQLRSQQEVIFFFLVLFLLTMTLASWIQFETPPSYPLKVVRLGPQEDGGTPELSP